MKLKDAFSLERKSMTKLDSVFFKKKFLIKSKYITLPIKICIVKAMVFSSSHVQMWELDHTEGLALKNWCFWIVVLQKTLDTPLDNNKIKLVNPKGNQPYIFIERTDAEAEAPIFWPPGGKSWFTEKDPDARKDWGQQEKRVQRVRWLDGIMTQWMWAWANSRR